MIAPLRSGNLLLEFLLELAMLAAFCLAGWSLGTATWMRAGLAIAVPAIAIFLWAAYAAPRAGKRRLKMPALIYFKLCMFAAATVAWFVAQQGFFGSVFAAMVLINLLGMWVFKQY